MANCVSGRRTTLLNTTLAENKRRGTKTRRSIFSTKMKFSLLLWTGPETSSTLIYLSSSPRRLFIPFGWIENFSPLEKEASILGQLEESGSRTIFYTLVKPRYRERGSRLEPFTFIPLHPSTSFRLETIAKPS